MSVRLNIGVGPHYADGWVNVDRVSVPEANICPDVIADFAALPYDDHTVDAVYAGHVLEHVALDRFDAVMAEVARVLVSAGTAWFVCPDVYRAIDGYAAGWVTRDVLLGCLEGPDSGVTADGAWEGHYHQWNCTEARLLGLVARTFPAAASLPVEALPDWLPVVSRIGWQCAVTVTA